jgi:diguanylate cyclase (GGDEF)-like protein
LRPPFIVNGQPLKLSCSVGVAVYPDNGTDAITLVKNADEAMYRAKDAGRDCVKQT